MHGREVERQLGLPSRLASYHLAALEEEGLVRRVEEGGYQRFLPAQPTLSPRDVEFVCLMRRPPAFHAALLLASQGTMTATAIATALGLAKASVSYHLKALLDAEVVRVEEVGRERRYSLRDAAYAKRMLVAFQPLPGELDAFSRLWDDLVGGKNR